MAGETETPPLRTYEVVLMRRANARIALPQFIVVPVEARSAAEARAVAEYEHDEWRATDAHAA